MNSGGAVGPGGSGAGLAAVGLRVADRYRLIERVGVHESGSVEFWVARDEVLARRVGVTVVCRAGGPERERWVDDVVAALLRWGQFSFLGCPRIMDVVGVGHVADRGVLPERLAAVVVTDWAPGPTLLAFVADPASAGDPADSGGGLAGGGRGGDATVAVGRVGPVSASAAVQMVAPLVAAADAAHGHGLVLGCYQPEVLHVAQAGTRTAHVHLGFLLTDPGRGAGDDVRGLGAVLYALLTGCWPASLQAPGVGVVDGIGSPPVAPHVLDAAVPVEVSGLAMSALGFPAVGAPLRTAADLQRALLGLRADDSPRPGHGLAATGSGGALAASAGTLRWAEPGSGESTAPSWSPSWSAAPTRASSRASGVSRWAAWMSRPRRVSAAAVALVAVVGLVGFGSVWRHHGRSVLAGQAPPAGAAAPGAPVNTLSGAAAVVSASVYDPTGQPDNPTQVWRALGADPKAGWSTDTYLQPFPALKPGVGIMVGFAGPVQLTSLTITSPSVGSQLELRSAPGPASGLAETTLMASTTLRAGETVVPLADSQPLTHVLVWITKLGGGGDDNVTEISNLRFQRSTE